MNAAVAMYAFAAAVGLCVGSFLNVVIARVPKGRSIVHPGSACPRCGRPIAWYDNVPVLSWLWLRARCRGCGLPISARYPLVELLGGAAAVLAVARHGPTGAAGVELAFADALLALAFIDLDTWLLPLGITIPLAAGALLAGALGLTPAGGIVAAALGGAVASGFFLAIALVGRHVFRREAMGMGDVFFVGGLAAFLGLRAVLPLVLLASLQGAVVGIVQLALGRSQPGPDAAPKAAARAADEDEDDWVPPRNAVPFGPFLALAALEWLYLAPQLARLAPVLEPFR